MSRSKRLIFFGNERLATSVSTTAPTLSKLVDNGYDIAAVVSHFSEATSRKPRPLEIAEVAKHHNIPLLLPEKPTDITSELADYKAEAAVLVAYGRLVPESIIDIFPAGIINIHPSMLPLYRGPTPLETAILDGVKTTGVSLMQLTAKMDAGPVYAQEEVSLSGNETKQELADKLLTIGAELLIDNLPAILDGRLKPKSQVDSQATYTKLLRKSDGVIDWQEPAELILRKIRAYQGFPKATARLFDKYDTVILKASQIDRPEDGELVIQANPGYVKIDELTAPSGKKVTGSEFLRGYKP